MRALEDELAHTLDGLVSGLDRVIRIDKSAYWLNFKRSELVLESSDALIVLPFILNYDRTMASISHFLGLFHRVRWLSKISKQCSCLERRFAHIYNCLLVCLLLELD